MSEQRTLAIPYPWQQDVWQRIGQQISQNKVPHAVLLSGQQGIGKWNFAQSLADYLLCLSPRADLACGQCRSCQLLLAQTHPDKKIVTPDEPGKAIKIEQIRELSAFVAKTAQQAGYKVVLLGPVEQLNINSANALLKSLEEPAGDTVLILYTHILSGVMATIRSRCQLLPMSAPSNEQAISWLENLNVSEPQAFLGLAGGAPLIAKEMAEGDYLEHLRLFMDTLAQLSSPSSAATQVPDISAASAWLDLGVNRLTQWWLQLIHRIVSTTDVSPPSQQSTADLGISESIHSLLVVGQQLNKQWLFKFSDKLLTLRQQHLQGANPNMQLLLEELLLDWQVIVHRSQKH